MTVCLQVVAQLRWLGTFTGVLTALAPVTAGSAAARDPYLEERSLTVLASAPGTISTVVGNGTAGFSGEGGAATAAELNGAFGVVVDGGGDDLVADTSNSRVRLVAGSDSSSECPFGLMSTTKGDIYTIAGDGMPGYRGDAGAATSAELDRPLGLALDPHGDVLIADYSNNRVRLVAAADCSSACPFGFTSMTKGDIYTVAGDGLTRDSGDGGPAVTAGLASASDVAVDSESDVVIADPNSGRVRLVAGTDCASGCPLGLSSMSLGHIYTVAGTSPESSSGDGGPATDATMVPSGVGMDDPGDLVIADTVRVRLVAGLDCSDACPYGLTSMTKGDVYTVAGSFFEGHSGDGGPATSATLQGPGDLKVDANGDLLIADWNAVRLVAAYTCSSQCPFGLMSMTASYIYTVAGTGVPGFSGDGGPATGAKLGRAFGLAIDSVGNLLIADIDNNRVRQVTLGQWLQLRRCR